MLNQIRDYLLIKKSGYFDARYYLRKYPDVRRSDIDPLIHYVRYGWKEDRNPGPLFDTHFYLESNPDVRQQNTNPLIHFIRYGKNEGRKPIEGFNINTGREAISEKKQNIQEDVARISKQGTHINLSGLRKKVNNGFNYLRVNGFKEFSKSILRKMGISKNKSDHKVNGSELMVGTSNNPYETAYVSSLATSSSFDKSEYVDFIEHESPVTPPEVKLIAFYLPQFHPIPENDAWWGKGFTEWTNVSKAVPQFVGHYQPHLPGELGFYDLRVPEVQHRQVELAKNYGIYGFCFYYYWFNGKRLLENPLKRFVQDPKIDFPFCICWANENWTRRWDGYERDVLIAQKHTHETDLAFIKDLFPYFRHRNYITIDGHPILIIYRIELLPDPQKTAILWREQCRIAGIKEPLLIAAQTFGFYDPRTVGFDAAVEFPPHNVGPEIITNQFQFLNQNFSGCVYRYAGKSSLSEIYGKMKHSGYKSFKTVSPGWDNEPRKPGKGNIFADSTPERYKNWLKNAYEITKNYLNPDERIVFINAWNEWGEGAYLEPDRKFGYAYLQATYDIVKQLSHDVLSTSHWTILFILHDAHVGGAQILIKNIINWLHLHTSIGIKLLFLAKGDMLSQYSALADTLVLEDHNLLSNEDFITRIIDFCGGKPDLIYGNTVAVGKVYRQLSSIDTPIVTHIHELEMSINRYASEWIDTLCKYSDRFICVSDAVKENLQANHSVAPELLSRVYGGITEKDNSYFLSDKEKQSLRGKLGLPKDKKLIVGCGRGMPFRKGADLFIQVAQHIQQLLPEQTQFIWIGDFEPHESDEKFGLWRDYQQKLEREKNIKFVGFQPSPQDYLRVADLFLLTSREDPFPLVMLEAAQCGLPVICFDQAGGAAEFVEFDAGMVVPFENVAKMAEASIKILTSDSLRTSLGERGREKVKHSYTVDAVSRKILSVCREVAEKPPQVSVIVPNYNHAKYLPERLESIFNQTFQDIEVIILDDASTDNSLEVIGHYSDRTEIKLIQNLSNSGSPFRQWLSGVENAQADLIWIAESDDRCESNFLQVLLPAFKDVNVKLAYTNSWIINSNGSVLGDYPSTNYLRDLSETKWNKSYKRSADGEINDGLGIKNTILNISSSIFRIPRFDKSIYDTLHSMHFAGDWYFIINLIHGGSVYYEAQKLNYHRRHDESVIGELIKNKKVVGFYSEIATVQKAVCELYNFDSTYLNKWIAYHHKQWSEFYPYDNFDSFKTIFPFDELMNLIKNKSGAI